MNVGIGVLHDPVELAASVGRVESLTYFINLFRIWRRENTSEALAIIEVSAHAPRLPSAWPTSQDSRQ
jgi:hypothetical protein